MRLSRWGRNGHSYHSRRRQLHHAAVRYQIECTHDIPVSSRHGLGAGYRTRLHQSMDRIRVKQVSRIRSSCPLACLLNVIWTPFPRLTFYAVRPPRSHSLICCIRALFPCSYCMILHRPQPGPGRVNVILQHQIASEDLPSNAAGASYENGHWLDNDHS